MISFFGVTAYCRSPFNGKFCSQGEVIIEGQVHKENKVIETSVTDTELHLKRDHTDFDDCSYMDGRPEDAFISSGKVVYNGTAIGTIAPTSLRTETTILGYNIKYAINSLMPDTLSFSRTSARGT